MIFMIKYTFTDMVFTAHTSLSFRKAIRSQAKKKLPLTRVSAHAILKVREEYAINGVLFAPKSNQMDSIMELLNH